MCCLRPDVEPHAPGTPPPGLPRPTFQLRAEKFLATDEVTVRSTTKVPVMPSAHVLWAR